MIATLRARIVGSGVDLILSVAVALVALLIALLFVVVSGVSIPRGASAFVTGAFGSKLTIAGTLSKMVPLTLVALGWIVAFKAGRFHIGFPGQILVGALFVSVLALKVSLPIGIHLPLTVLAGVAGGAAFAGIAAWLWARHGVNEVLSTLLLNLVAAQLLAWWVRGPFHDSSSPSPLTPPLPSSARWPELLTHTPLHWDIVLVPVVTALVWLLLSRTPFGFRTRLVGAGEEIAWHAGISPTRVGMKAIVLSGALAGLAGSSLVLAAVAPAMAENVGATAGSSNYGFTGIAVALLARNSPLGVLPAALLFAALEQGGSVMEGTVGISSSLVDFIQGLMIVLVLAATTLLYFARRRAHSHRRGPQGSRRTAMAQTEISA